MISPKELSLADVDLMILRCSYALTSHDLEIKFGGQNTKDATAAFDATVGKLKNLLEIAPPTEHERIQSLLHQYGVE